MRTEVVILAIQQTLKALADPVRREILNLLPKWPSVTLQFHTLKTVYTVKCLLRQ